MRSKSREVAMQLLFQKDTNKVPVARKEIVLFAKMRLRHDNAISFALSLYDGVLKQQSEIDSLISKTSDRWKLHRLLPVDRNVLRLGTYELLHATEETPTAVILNEAIELSRRFGGKDSPGFVNGILGKICELRGQVVTVAHSTAEEPELPKEPSLPPSAAEAPG